MVAITCSTCSQLACDNLSVPQVPWPLQLGKPGLKDPVGLATHGVEVPVALGAEQRWGDQDAVSC